MKVHRLTERLQTQFIGSLDFESDEQFRVQMGRLVNRAMTLVGTLGPIAVATFLGAQIVVLGKVPAWSYNPVAPHTVTVLWDKLVMAAVFLGLLGLRPFLPDDRPALGRAAMLLASIVVIVAITVDDVGAQTIRFSPAYTTLIVLFLSVAVPMHAGWALTAIGLTVGSGYLAVTHLPVWFGLDPANFDGEHAVYLAVVAMIALATSTLLYVVRHEEFLARKMAEDLSGALSETNQSLEDAIMNLTAAQDRLVYAEKMASLGRFAAGVAHELRNPLNFVSNFAKLSVDLLPESQEAPGLADTAGDDLRENLQRILEHSGRAERIVRSLVANSPQRTTQLALVDVNHLVTEQASVVSQRYEAERSGVSIRLSMVLDETLGTFEALPGEMAYALGNIVDNAYRAVIDRASAGESGYEAEIAISTIRQDGGVRIEIRDNGVGIPKAETGKIFEPFYTTRPAGSGIGLGLASAYAAITEGHGGSITVQSEPGAGSVFSIELGERLR